MSSTGSSSPQPNASSNSNTNYFVDQKKGEVNELKQALKNIGMEKEPKRKREIIKKVIAYMTLGIDVSRLMTDMIMAIETKDIVVKKMVYFYLCNYAHAEPELAIMCINTLRRDCDNDDPTVRGLALRSLCGLRLESMLEYMQQPLQKSLNDVSPYVRKTGVMAILKIYSLSPGIIETQGYIPQLYRMIQDADANVVTNAIFVLNELLLSKGGIEITQTMILSLLNRISEFSEWGLNSILDLVTRYSPVNEEEMYSIMNLLDPVLRTASSAAVIATFKCFMKFSSLNPELQPQIYSRSKPPLLTLITGGNPEVQYAVLKHLQVMLQRKAAKKLFDDEYRQFYVRYNEPPYVKHLKVDVLPLLANDTNAREISNELGEYVTDVDSELSKRAIAALAEIGMRVPSFTAEMTNQLVALIELDMSYVRNEAVKNIANVLRIYPHGKTYIIPYISRCLKRVDDAESKASLIWMLGEYGKDILEAPYMIEPMIDNYSEENSMIIKLHLLSATMKLFFKRPPETQAMLGRLLKQAVNDNSHQDVHDRALLYIRLLSSDINAAASLFHGLGTDANNHAISKGFAELLDVDKLSQIFDEFNTLAVIYGMPSKRFVSESYQSTAKLIHIPDYDPLTVSVAGQSNSVPNGNHGSASAPAGPLHGADSIPPQISFNNPNLLDLDDNPLVVNHTSPQNSPAGLSLKASVDLTPQQYQSLWLSLDESFNGRLCGVANVPKKTTDVDNVLRQQKIITVASGPLTSSDGHSQGLKFFLTAAENDNFLTAEAGPLYLLQLTIIESTGEVTVILKTTSSRSDGSLRFVEYLTNVFRPFGLRP